MKKRVRLSESQLSKLIQRAINENAQRRKLRNPLARKVTESVIRKLNEGYGYGQTVTILMDDYINLLNARRKEVEPRGWTIPDCVWDYFIELVEDGGMGDDPQHNSPSYVVDNIAVNGDYGDFDEYKEDGESDEDFIARVEDDCMAIFPEERIVIYSL